MASTALRLTGIGCKVVENSADRTIGVRSPFYWDVAFTKVTQILLVRRVERLTAEMIDQDLEWLKTHSTELDPSALPRGFQKGMAVFAFYECESAEPEAIARIESKESLRFAWFFFPGARVGDSVHYLRSTPIWGAAYYTKFRWVAERVLGHSTEDEPISWLMLGLLGGLIVLPVLLIFLLGVLVALT